MKPNPLLLLALLLAGAAHAADLPPVVERYESLLARNPQKGTAFDKVYQHFLETGQLDALQTRWKARAEAGENAAQWQLLLGLLAERRGDYAQAKDAYTRLTTQTPENAAAWAALARLEMLTSNPKAALPAYRTAIEKTATGEARAALLRELAQAQARLLDAEGALATWQQLAKETPDDPAVLDEAATALAAVGRQEEAAALLENLRKLPEADAFQKLKALVALGGLEEARGQNAKALERYEAALAESSPTSWVHRSVRANIERLFRKQDDLPSLASYYEGWLTRNGNDVQAAAALSTVLTELKRRTEAATWLRKACEWAPEDATLKLQLATLLRETGDAPGALELLGQLARQHPQEPRFATELGEAHWAQSAEGTQAAARAAALESWAQIAPEGTRDVGRVALLADLLARHGLNAEAAAQYERAVALAPDASDLRERWAALLFREEKEQAAWAVLEGLVAEERATAANFLRLAQLQQRHGGAEKARATLALALEKYPADFPLLRLRWELLAEAKEWEAAFATWERAAAAAPGPLPLEQLERAKAAQLAVAGRLESERDALAAKLDSLSEPELRLLIHLALSDATRQADLLRKALEPGRFADSVAMARLQAAAYQILRDPAGQVSALRRWVGLEPKQRVDGLEQITLVWQQAGQYDKALEAARELAAAAPASPKGPLLEATLLAAAGKREEAVTQFHKAMALSDRPNEIRLRLAEMYNRHGEAEKAIATYEEAFEAEEDAGRKQALIRPIATLAQQTGRLDALLTSFKQRQAADEAGWRYTAYLVEIYQQTDDLAQARAELEKVIALRPKEPALLRQAADLARREGNLDAQIGYLEQLATLEPDLLNRHAFLEALFTSGRIREKMALIEEAMPEVVANRPLSRRFLARMRNTPTAAPLLKRYEAELRAQADTLQDPLALPELYIASGQYEKARPLLEAMLLTPPVPPPAPATPSQRQMPGIQGRFQRGTPIVASIYEWLPDLRSNVYWGLPSILPPPDTDTYRIAAAIYLSVLARLEGKEEAYLQQLDRVLTEPDDRLVIFAQIQAREPLLKEIRNALQDPNAQDRAQFGIGQLQFWFHGSGSEWTPELEQIEKMLADYRKIPNASTSNTLHLELMLLERKLNTGQTEAARAHVGELLANPAQTRGLNDILSLLQLAGRTGFQKEVQSLIKEALALLDEQAAQNPQFASQTTLEYLARFRLIDDAANVLAPVEAAFFKQMLHTLREAPPTAAHPFPWALLNDQSLLVVSGYFDPYFLQIFAVAFREGENLPLLKVLDKEAPTLKPRQRIRAELLRAQLLWAGGQREAAATAAAALAKAHPQDADIALFAAHALGENGNPQAALPLLEALSSSPPALAQRRDYLALRYLLAANRNEEARPVAERLLANPPAEAYRELQAAVATLGLKATSSLLARQPRPRSANRHQVMEENVRQLDELTSANKTEEAVALAREILASTGPGDPQLGNWQRNRALNALEKGDAMPAYLAKLEADLAAQPESLTVLQLLIEAHNGRGAWTHEKVNTAQKSPLWLKLTRKGRTFTGSVSADGEQWKEVGSAEIDLAETLDAGFALTGKGRDNPVEARFTAVAPAPEGPWQERAIGSKVAPGTFRQEADAYIVQGTGRDIYGTVDAFFFVSQPLTGDGERIARLETSATHPVKIGLMFREGGKAGARYVALLFRGNDGVGFQYRKAVYDPEPYLRELVRLQPDELKWQMQLGTCLAAQEREAEALVILRAIAAKDIEPFFPTCTEVIAAFREEGALPDLAEAALVWKQSPPPANGQVHPPVYFYQELTEALRKAGQLDLAERVARYGQGLNHYGSATRLNHELAKVFLLQKKDDATTAELLEILYPEGKRSQGSPSTSLLGFGQRYGSPPNDWTDPIFFGRQLSCEALLTLAEMPEPILQTVAGEVRARLKRNPALNGADALLAYLAARNRDPALANQLPPLLKPGRRLLNGEIVALLAIADELQAWPGHEKEAIAVRKALNRHLGNPNQFIHYGYEENLFCLALLQSTLGDAKGATETLEILRPIVEVKIAQPRQNKRHQTDYSDTEALRLLALQQRVRDEKGFIHTYDALRAAPQGKKVGGWTLDEEKKQFLGTFEQLVALPWLLNDGDAAPAPTVVYEIRGKHPRQKGAVNRLIMSRGGMRGAVFEAPRTLTLLYGRTPEALEPLGTFKTKDAAGTWKAKVPPGLGYLAIREEKGEPFTHPAIAILRGKNLVQNPNFDGLAKRPTARGPFSLPGWKELPAGFWRLTPGGPRAGGTFVEVYPSDEKEHLLIGERVPIEPGCSYFQSAWLRAMDSWGHGVAFGRRFLDAEGKELETTYIPAYHSINWRRHSQTLAPDAKAAHDRIPPNAAFMEPVVRLRRGADFTNLFLGTIPKDTP